MATLTSAQLAELRKSCQDETLLPNVTKPTFNVALQAIEDRWEVVRSSFGVAIENAAPGVFTNADKARLVKHWLKQRFDRGG